ncbi:hypothetical protein D9J30_03450 [Escherichia coli]|uniref:Phage protein n=1 Tax=Escherichia coli O8 TaxID=1010796 RepID=A0A9P2MLK7_ECOLX|nr:hypothetical protein [Escherichia coli]EFO2014058.1 hypothetical protein [Escherichia coli O8]EEV4189269.1 hypothetical protein [Escherichia coli]EEW1653578.1 hypothetical protein [Escherichia coli]EEX5835157.1 hypothetical protein [Escherichia coli]EFA3940486.1 hypothetical protein [Escherichia coli]
MSKSLEDLNAVLFSQIDKLSTEEPGDKLSEEIKRSKAMVGVADTIIANSRLVFDIYESQGGMKSIENRPDILRVKKHTGNGK